MRVRGIEYWRVYVANIMPRQRILLQRPPIADVLQQHTHEDDLRRLASYCRSHHVPALCTKQRIPKTCTYLKVVAKGEHK